MRLLAGNTGVFRPGNFVLACLALGMTLNLANCGGSTSSSMSSGSNPPVMTPPPPAGSTDVVTYHNDNARTGQNLNETTLTTSNVNSGTFGKLFTIPADGKVNAEPLYLSNLTINQAAHNVLFVASEHGTVYAFDADTGTMLWQVSTLQSGETTSDDHGCGQITPEIGITSTPVIDRSAGTHGTIYVVAMSKDASGIIISVCMP